MTTIEKQTMEVVEDEMAVWVSVGVETWDLMVYLGDYVTPSAPKGEKRHHSESWVLYL